MVGTNRKRNIIIQSIIVLVILILLNVISQGFYSFIDLTEDKRFTLTKSTENLLEQIDDVVYVNVLLDGDLPSGFKRLQKRTEEILKQFKSISPSIEYTFRNPSKGTTEEINTLRSNLSKDGIFPVNLFVMDDDQKVEKLIYPYLVLQYGSRKLPINILESQQANESEEVTLNRSAISLEYKLANGLLKIFQKDAPIVLFTKGNGELEQTQTADLENSISGMVNTGRVDLDSIHHLSQDVDVLIVAGPTTKLSDRNKFIIDQYIMNGGKVIWLVDQLRVELDSLSQNTYVPRPVNHGLDDMLFKYGIRINKNLVLDLENSKIPQVIGRKGGKVQTELFPWVYYPVLQSSTEHPIVNYLDRVFSTFPSSIEVLDQKSGLESINLLTSSSNSRFQLYPMTLSFDIVKEQETNKEAYNKANLPVAVMIEGKFSSFYKNRVKQSMEDALKKIGTEFKETSVPTSQIFIADSDLIRNLVDSQNRIAPMGYNKWEKFTYVGNKDFFVNCIDYLTDDYGLIESRSKNFKLRMLDQAKISKNRIWLQVVNIGLPILLVIVFGILFTLLRRRKYAN